MGYLNGSNTATIYTGHARDCKYNGIIAVNKSSLDQIADLEQSIFSNWTAITDFITSINLIFIKARYFLDNRENQFVMTDKGVATAIKCKGVDAPYKLVKIAQQFIEYKDYTDTINYTEYELVLPFICAVPIDQTVFFNKYLTVYAGFDLFTATGTYYIMALDAEDIDPDIELDDNDNIIPHNYKTAPIMTIPFTFGVSVPFGTTGMGDMIRNTAIKTLSTIGSIVATAYTGVPIVMPSPTTTTTTRLGLPTSAVTSYTGNSKLVPYVNKEKIQFNAGDFPSSPERHTAYVNCEAIANSLSILNTPIHNSQLRSSSDSSSLFTENITRCCLIKRTKKLKPIGHAYGYLFGFPLGEIRLLSTLSGYTKISKIILEAPSEYADETFSKATEQEKELLEATLYDGVVL